MLRRPGSSKGQAPAWLDKATPPGSINDTEIDTLTTPLFHAYPLYAPTAPAPFRPDSSANWNANRASV